MVAVMSIACGSETVNPRPSTAHVQPGIDANAPWPIAGHDEGFTARAMVHGSRSGGIRWSVDTGAAIGPSSPVVGADGTIYIGNSAGTLVAVDRFGVEKWRTSIGGSIESAATIGENAIWIGADDAQVHVIDFDGRPIGTILASASIRSPVILDGDEVAYFGTSPFGTPCSGRRNAPAACATRYQGTPVATNCPFAIADDRFYSASYGRVDIDDATGVPGRLLAVTPGGEVFTSVYFESRVEVHDASGAWLWAVDLATSREPMASLVTIGVVDRNNAYVLRARTLFRVGQSGIDWSLPLDSDVEGMLAVDVDGVVYFGTTDDKLHAIDSHGATIFTTMLGGAIRSSPAIGGDGTIYIGADDGRLYAVGR